VVGIVLGDVLLAGLRRIAQESLTHRRYRGGVVPGQPHESDETNETNETEEPT